MDKRLYFVIIFIFILFFFIGCNTLGPLAVGPAGEELLYLAPGDKIQLDNGQLVYVDKNGLLRGVEGVHIIAAGKKARDVMKFLSDYVSFKKYKIVEYGKRYIEIGGLGDKSGIYDYPLYEDWNIMNLLLNIEGYRHSNIIREYLLVRKAYSFPGSYIFLRGEALPVVESAQSIGGDDLLILSGDKILFPGDKELVYIFGAVSNPICFTFKNKKPTLKDAINQAKGLLKVANRDNIQVYRMLRLKNRKIYNLKWNIEKNFKLEPWDIIYVPFKIPRKFLK